MRSLLAVTATALLALTACSTDEPAPSEPPSTTEAAQQSGPIELALGETAHLTKSVDGPQDITVTLTDISVSDQCANGLNDWHDDYTHEGGYFVQVAGDIDVKSAPRDFTIPQWMAADENRNMIEVVPATECAASPDTGVQTFGHLVVPGSKATAVEEYWVDTLPSHWFLNKPYEDHAFSWPVPQDVSEVREPASEGIASPTVPATPAAPATQAPAAQSAPAAAPSAPQSPPVGITGAPGAANPAPLDKTIQQCLTGPQYQRGTTSFTDGTTGWTQQCAAQG